MSMQLLMPKAGLTNTEGTVGEWKMPEGSSVNKGDIILEVENEKSVMDFLSPGEGILHIIACQGTEVVVGGVMGCLAQNQAEYDRLCGEDQANVSKAPDQSRAEVAPVSDRLQEMPVQNDRGGMRVKSSPLARAVAKQNDVDISKIEGSGPGGRIVRKDVDDYLQSKSATKGCKNEIATRAPIHIPLNAARKAIAKNMTESLRSMAQTSDSVELDVTELVKLRNKLVANEENLGTRITYTDLFARACIKMLAQYPLANASFAQTEIISYPNVNLSIGVATDFGLTSPVIRDADTMSLVEFSLALKDSIARARKNKLTMNDITGGTFTITNMGVYPVDHFNPIINPPQSAIMGFGRMVEKPVVFGGEIVIRTMMFISITYDHRVFDGSDVGGIFGCMKQYLENPELILI